MVIVVEVVNNVVRSSILFLGIPHERLRCAGKWEVLQHITSQATCDARSSCHGSGDQEVLEMLLLNLNFLPGLLSPWDILGFIFGFAVNNSAFGYTCRS